MSDLMNIENKIMIIRDQQVMLDRDLADIYGYTTKAFNQQVKNNIEKFPDDMMFQLNQAEVDLLSRSKFLTLNGGRGHNIKYLPFAFTEQGIYMLMTVLKGELATQQSIALVRLFKQMRHYFAENAGIISRIASAETKIIEHDQRINTLFTLVDKYKIKDKQDIFFQGQIFDAYAAFQGLIQQAQKEIILIDNYIDLSVLERFSKKNPSKMHDRFLIIDNTAIYFIGASIKDLGKKCFGFMQLEDAQWMIKTVLSAL